MRKLIPFFLAFFILTASASATITYQSARFPPSLLRSESTLFNFNWTAISDNLNLSNNISSFLEITQSGNETNFFLNQTLTCENNTVCNVTVTGFAVGFYQWRVLSFDENDTNVTLLAIFFEVLAEDNNTFFKWTNDSGFEAMRLNKNTGDLSPAGTLNLSGASLSVDTLDVSGNITGGNITIDGEVKGDSGDLNTLDVEGLATIGNLTVEGDIVGASCNAISGNFTDVFSLAGNSTLWDLNFFSWDANHSDWDLSTISWLANGSNWDDNTTDWVNLQLHPIPCPSGTFISAVNDSNTCTAPTAADVDPGTYPSGNYIYPDNLTVNDVLVGDLDCTNVTGAASNLCTIVALDSENVGDFTFNNVTFNSSTDRFGVGTPSPNSPMEVLGLSPGTVGGFASGQLHIRSTGGLSNNAVITGHNSLNTNTQLWYLGSTSSSNNNIGFINRQDGNLVFQTNNTEKIRIVSGGAIHIIGDINNTDFDIITETIIDDTIFAQLSSSVNQTPSNTTPLVITYNIQDGINGLNHSVSTLSGEIGILTAGVYFISPQPQVGKSSGATAVDFDMFLQVNRGGSGFADEPNSNIKLTIKDQDITDVIVSAFTVSLKVNDRIRMMQRIGDDGVGMALMATGAEVGPPTVPATPSIIFTMYRVGG